jgi:hypothetical protein
VGGENQSINFQLQSRESNQQSTSRTAINFNLHRKPLPLVICTLYKEEKLD